mmetsp:Transcript_6144/g.10943  ORF Transcript_6144/g.10943 Transcript_6144/m.10943 type:complete len:86 (-) Transcript_6144:603-860(-)
MAWCVNTLCYNSCQLTKLCVCYEPDVRNSLKPCNFIKTKLNLGRKTSTRRYSRVHETSSLSKKPEFNSASTTSTSTHLQQLELLI